MQSRSKIITGYPYIYIHTGQSTVLASKNCQYIYELSMLIYAHCAGGVLLFCVECTPTLGLVYVLVLWPSPFTNLANRCPPDYPYVYFSGKYCCKYSRMKFYIWQGNVRKTNFYKEQIKAGVKKIWHQSKSIKSSKYFSGRQQYVKLDSDTRKYSKFKVICLMSLMNKYIQI